jgi:hypothetical protein
VLRPFGGMRPAAEGLPESVGGLGMWEADHGCYGYTFDYFFRASDLLTRVFVLGVGPVGGPRRMLGIFG